MTRMDDVPKLVRPPAMDQFEAYAEALLVLLAKYPVVEGRSVHQLHTSYMCVHCRRLAVERIKHVLSLGTVDAGEVVNVTYLLLDVGIPNDEVLSVYSLLFL